MEAINPFADPEFKKQILKKETGHLKQRDPDDYVLLEDEEEKTDMKSIIQGTPKLPKQASNIILDANLLAKNEREENVKQMQLSINQVFSDYNKKYGTDLQLDLGNLSNSLVAVSTPEKRRVLQLYVSEMFQSLKPLMILHMLERLTVCINYLLSPEMMFNKNEMSIPDIWVACQQIMNMMDQLNAMKDDIEIKGSDLELKKLTEENSDVDFENEDNKQAISDFMNLFNKEFSLK